MKRTLENPGGTIRVPKVYSMETCQSLRRKDREVKFISVYFIEIVINNLIFLR